MQTLNNQRLFAFFFYLMIIIIFFSCALLANESIHPNHLQESIEDVFKPISIDLLHKIYDDFPEKQNEVDEMFQIKKIYNPLNKNHKKIIAYSLFWKPMYTRLPQPIVSKESIFKVQEFARKTCSFYENYVSPMLSFIRESKNYYTDLIFRIYLAADLEFLIPHLLKSNVEIYLMSSNSIASSPGMMWRFLAFDDQDADFVFIRDSDEPFNRNLEKRILWWLNNPHTTGWYRANLLCWRENLYEAIYSPLVGFCFGAKNPHYLNIEKAMKGYIIYRQQYANEPRHPRDVSYDDHPYGFGNEFPSYGFDERFLKHVIYYETASRGELTFLPIDFDIQKAIQELANAPENHLVRMDLEFIRLYNPDPIYVKFNTGLPRKKGGIPH